MNGIVTGASRGLGLALTRALSERGWRLVVDARDADELERAVAGLDGVVPIAGDVADPEHRARLVDAAGAPIDLLVNNASTLGATPLPALGDYGLEALRHVYEVNVVAPLALVQLALPRLGEGARIVNVSSDAAVEAYEGWGGYGSSKAALAHLTAVLGVENPTLRAYAVDPGRHAHPDAAGRVPRRGHLRPAVAGGERAGLPGADRGRPAERRLPGEGHRGGRGMSSLAFELPRRLEAHEPPEASGRSRDDVRLLVSDRATGVVLHSRFAELPRFLRAGDLVVVNTSATLAAALPATRTDGAVLELRLSTPAQDRDPEHYWIVELRSGDDPFGAVEVGERLALPGGAHAEIVAPYSAARLWLARLELPAPVEAYLAEHGRPIRYRYVPRSWPLSAYQNVYATEPGSAEMASAGRPFTAELVTRLVAGGVLVAPITLHTGVSSQESHERPYPERYRVSEQTARLVNAVRGWGGRVVATGTTVVRALETTARAGRHRGRRRGLDESRRHPGARALGRGRPAHRPARGRVVASRPAPCRRRREAARLELPSRRPARLPLARVRRQPAHPLRASFRKKPRAVGARLGTSSSLARSDAEHDVAGLLAGLDVASRLDDLVERVGPVDHGPVLPRFHELLDEQEVLLAIAADPERRPSAPDEAGDESEERDVVQEPEIHRDVDPAGPQGAATAAKRVLADRVEDHVVRLAARREVLGEAVDDVARAERPHDARRPSVSHTAVTSASKWWASN